MGNTKILTDEEEEIITNEWSEIHKKFLKDITELINKHGGRKKVDIQCAGREPRDMRLVIK